MRSSVRTVEELRKEVHDIVQEAVIKTTPKRKKCKRQNGCQGEAQPGSIIKQLDLLQNVVLCFGF